MSDEDKKQRALLFIQENKDKVKDLEKFVILLDSEDEEVLQKTYDCLGLVAANLEMLRLLGGDS